MLILGAMISALFCGILSGYFACWLMENIDD